MAEDAEKIETQEETEIPKPKYEFIEDLPGVGKYAADSWKIFQEGNIDIQVEDKELIKYVEWAQEYRNKNQKSYIRSN